MRALLAALLVLFAGCTAAPVGSDADTNRPLPTPTDTCESTTPTPTGSNQVTPRPWPTPPEQRTTETVESYVVAFERAFLHNHRLESSTRYLETHLGQVNVTRRDDVFLVRLTSYTNGGVARSTPGAETPITIHWDGAPVHVAYLLTDGRLVRAEGEHETTPTVEQVVAGRTVACY